MNIGLTGSLFTTNKVLAIYAIAITAVGGSILLLPAQAPTPNVRYNLFKVGQTSPDQTILAAGWKPVGYACQASNPTQVANGAGPTVCGYRYTYASHNLITNAGIDWLACAMNRLAKCTVTGVDQYVALGTTTGCGSQQGQQVTDVAMMTNAVQLGIELTGSGLARATGTFAHTNGTATYTQSKLFTASGTVNNVCASGLFTLSSAPASAQTLVFENTFGTVNMLNNDQLSVTWTVTL
jgi:hypothetical protein